MLRPGSPQLRLHLRRPKMKRPTMNQLIPNALTVGALCAGLTAIRFGLLERWDLAVFALVVAGIFDGLDGRTARLLGVTSKFGAELDSLSDFISFGVAPVLVIYLWTLHQFAGLGWALVMLFAVCCALRLARFNTALGDPNPPPWARYYFTGVPAPAGAGLMLVPLMLYLETDSVFFARPSVNAIVAVAVALLMISRIPTFSIKQIRIQPNQRLAALVVVAMLAAGLASVPFIIFICVGVIYVISIPIAVWTQARARQRTAAAQPPPSQGASPSLPPAQVAPVMPTSDEHAAPR